MRCRLNGQPMEGWSQPLKDQFPFPLAPEFWGIWSDNWLETDLLICRTYVVRYNICSELFRCDYSV
jgi:hypothetical protein